MIYLKIFSPLNILTVLKTHIVDFLPFVSQQLVIFIDIESELKELSKAE